MLDFLPEKTPERDPLTEAECRALRAEHKLMRVQKLVKVLNRNNSILIKRAYQPERALQWVE
jgi:hypothetical protein